MKESQNGNHQGHDDAVIMDYSNEVYELIMDYANEIYDWVNRHLEAERARGTVWEILVESAASDVSQPARENVQHFISSVIFRCIKHDDRDQWELDDIWDTVDLSHLDDIQLVGNYVLHIDQRDDDGENVDIRNELIENPNVVLLRTALDWSRDDGNVWSQQVIWSGSFTECRRIVQLFDEASSNSASSCIQVRSQHFDLHLDLRNQFIYRHDTYPLAATISAVESSPTV